MNRRDWLRRTALIATGVVAADQLELLEKLTWKRTLFPGFSRPIMISKQYALGFSISEEMLEDSFVYDFPRNLYIQQTKILKAFDDDHYRGYFTSESLPEVRDVVPDFEASQGI